MWSVMPGAHHVILATAGYDHAIRFWEATTGICYRTVQYGDSQVNRLEITPDKTQLAAAGNPHVRMFDINSSNPQATHSYDGHTGNVTAVGFNVNGNWMYTGSEDGTVKIWDIRAPGCQREYVGRAGVNTVCLHPNQTELISGDQVRFDSRSHIHAHTHKLSLSLSLFCFDAYSLPHLSMYSRDADTYIVHPFSTRLCATYLNGMRTYMHRMAMYEYGI